MTRHSLLPVTTRDPRAITRVNHAPGCSRPGWIVERSPSNSRVTIGRCSACGAVELRTEATPKVDASTRTG